ncbi:DUF4153 domain-containing protein [Erythrobacter sp. W302b]|uniref:DUF4153 domain-containing protein n=1 Tax=Erythrobacter sp. W302b TaxID=3389874 RepID=UPI00396B0331
MPGALTIPSWSRYSFAMKLGGALALLVVADGLLYGYGGGAVIGLFALIWLAVMVLVRPAVRHARGGWIALLCGALFAASLIHNPGPLAGLLFLIAIGSAALLPRHVFDHAGLWFLRLTTLGMGAPFWPIADAWRLASMSGQRGSMGKSILLNVALPLIGGALFLSLFASANPVLGNAVAAIEWPDLTTLIGHGLLLGVTLVFVWPTLRPRALRFASARQAWLPQMPDPSVTMMLVTLLVFNAVFALENGLDIVFLWSGAPLPDGITLADYAHRGAYTLIATALLAGLFVLVALRPGSPSAQTPIIRRLLLAWVAQNLLLVASSILRLLDYIDAYSLTEWRIAALVWMVLVATGLVLICWRFLHGQSAAWLINANVLAAGIVLSVSTLVDYGAIAARWNVDHLRDPARLDLCYLERLESSALIPLLELRKAPVGNRLRDQASYLSGVAYRRLAESQSDWQSWTVRGALRLAEADALLAGNALTPLPAPHGRMCGGEILPPPPRRSHCLSRQLQH